MTKLVKIAETKIGTFDIFSTDSLITICQGIYASTKTASGYLLLSKTNMMYDTGISKRFVYGYPGSVFNNRKDKDAPAHIWFNNENIYIQYLKKDSEEHVLFTQKFQIESNGNIKKLAPHIFTFDKKFKIVYHYKNNFLFISCESKMTDCWFAIINVTNLSHTKYDACFVKNNLQRESRFILLHNSQLYIILDTQNGELQLQDAKLKAYYQDLIIVDDHILVCKRRDDNIEYWKIIENTDNDCNICGQNIKSNWILSCGHQSYCSDNCFSDPNFKCNICNIRPTGVLPPTVINPSTEIFGTSSSLPSTLTSADSSQKLSVVNLINKPEKSQYSFMPKTLGYDNCNELTTYSKLVIE